MNESEKWKRSRSVVSNSERPHRLQPTRLLHPWDFPGKSTGVGCQCLLRIPGLGWDKYKLRQEHLMLLEKQRSTQKRTMALHSSTLAWKIPWTEEPGGLQSMGLLRVRHDWATSLSLFIFMHWRRKWQPTPVFLPGESQGQGSLVGCRLWGHTESDTTEAT